MYIPLFFYSLLFYQFIFAIFFQKNIFYYILSPYSLSALLIILLFFRKHGDPVFRNYYLIYFYFFIILLIIGFKLIISSDITIFNSIKKIQFTYGILILIPGFLILKDILNLKKYKNRDTYRNFIKYCLLFVSIITIYEFINVGILSYDASSIFYINETFIYLDATNTDGPFGYRPYGLMFYPQPNGLLISFLLSLYLISTRKFNGLMFFGTMALIVSQSYSGMLFFLSYFIFVSEFRYKKFLLIFFILLIIILSFSLNSSEFFYKFTPTYFEILLFREGQLFSQLASLKILNFYELIFGNYNYQNDISHEWMYPSIIREFGIIGLLIFLIIYSKIIFYTLPQTMKKNQRILFVLFFLTINAHYPSICFIPFQILLVLIYSINSYDIKKSN